MTWSFFVSARRGKDGSFFVGLGIRTFRINTSSARVFKSRCSTERVGYDSVRLSTAAKKSSLARISAVGTRSCQCGAVVAAAWMLSSW